MTSVDLEKDISRLEAELESGKLEEAVIRELNEKRALLAQKPQQKSKYKKPMDRFEGIRAAQLRAMHR